MSAPFSPPSSVRDEDAAQKKRKDSLIASPSAPPKTIQAAAGSDTTPPRLLPPFYPRTFLTDGKLWPPLFFLFLPHADERPHTVRSPQTHAPSNCTQKIPQTFRPRPTYSPSSRSWAPEGAPPLRARAIADVIDAPKPSPPFPIIPAT